MFLCLASQKPSEREFFVPAGTDLGVKLLSGANRLSRKTKFLGNPLRRKTEVFSQTMEQQMAVSILY